MQFETSPSTHHFLTLFPLDAHDERFKKRLINCTSDSLRLIQLDTEIYIYITTDVDFVAKISCESTLSQYCDTIFTEHEIKVLIYLGANNTDT